MAYSYVYYDGDGTTQTFAIPFSVLKRNEVKVQVDGVDLSSGYTVNSGATAVTITTPPPAGTGNVKVYRVTAVSPDGARPVDFQNGSRVRAEEADRAILHLLHATQEALDRANDALREIETDRTKWDGEGKELTNLGPPVGLTSAARLQDLQSIQQVAGNLPVVTPANDKSTLAVVGGVWTTRTPADFTTTDLGLKSGAFAPYGTAARNLVILDNSARLPAIDGRNLTNLNLNASVLSLLSGGGGGSASVPTVSYRFTSGAVLNTTSLTWNTDSGGTLGRLDVSANQAGSELFNAISGGGNYIDKDVATNIITLNTAGAYEIEIQAVLANRDTTLSGAVTFMLTDAAGSVIFWQSSGSMFLGPRAAGAWGGEKLVINKRFNLSFASAQTLTMKAVHNSAGGNVWCLGDGTQITIRKIG